MLIIEKIEGGVVTIENGDSFINADISQFDGNINEGDVIIMTEYQTYRKDENATAARRKEIIKLQNSLWK